MDTLQNFIDDTLVINERSSITHSLLLEKYLAWSHAHNEFPLTSKRLAGKLREKGFQSYRGSNHVTMWKGIALDKDKQLLLDHN